MDYFFLIVRFFIVFVLTKAQSESDTSVTNKPWFWPLLSITLAFLLSVPCLLIIVVFICYNKYSSNDDSDQSSIQSTSSISVERHNHHSRYIEGVRSPPPRYSTYERPSNLFMTSSPPPPYESHIDENPSTIVNIPLPPTTALDLSATLTSPSMQTFQA